MDSAPVRLIAVDLDGTLLNRQKRVCDHAAAALREASDRGVPVVIASARPPRSVRRIYRDLGLSTWQINYNGAMGWDEVGQRIVWHMPLPGELALRIIDAARAISSSIEVTCEILDRWFTDRLEQIHLTETARLFPPDVVAPVETFCTQPVTKLILLADPAIIDQLAAMVERDFPEVAIAQSDPDILQIMERGVNKGSALARVAENYGVPLANVLAIGDARNDIPMLQVAGIAVAMGNAEPLVQRAAHWIAPTNDDRGVHAALRQFGVAD